MQVDADKDRLVSLGEFLESAKSAKFSQNEAWEVRGQPRIRSSASRSAPG